MSLNLDYDRLVAVATTATNHLSSDVQSFLLHAVDTYRQSFLWNDWEDNSDDIEALIAQAIEEILQEETVPAVEWPSFHHFAYRTLINQSLGMAAFATTSPYYLSWYNTSQQDQDDSNVFRIGFQAGTWSCKLWYGQNTNRGKVSVLLDGDTLCTFDMYGAANESFYETKTGLTIATSGEKLFKLRIDGKNASSSGYAFVGNAIDLWRTA